MSPDGISLNGILTNMSHSVLNRQELNYLIDRCYRKAKSILREKRTYVQVLKELREKALNETLFCKFEELTTGVYELKERIISTENNQSEHSVVV